MMITPTIRIQSAPFDLAAEMALLTAERRDIGAVVTFTGLCRDEGGRLSTLELEHYPGMAEAQITRTANEALARWPLTGLTAIHRYGLVKPGEDIVLVIAASAHRGAAFAGASFMMDYLKTQAPFWKREHLVDGTVGGWVEAKAEDDAAAAKWHKGS
jgi:molybdopterin synthase catalytic subunit